MLRKLKNRVRRRTLRVRSGLSSSTPRVSVFRSLNHIYAQLIDDAQQKTLVSASSLEIKKVKGSKKDVAHTVGLELAKKALSQGFAQVTFDRGPFLYHGRVKSLAEGLRAGGLKV
ncbi:MAG: 50S ribosomal protein L18 [Candidatus Babeliaceae bacterium]|nr:50S ribosomal protein L18 [Candidatus Babeliaceae bacterium]